MSDSEVLVRVEHVSKKFCRSLKRSLWYGMQDIVSELNPFHRSADSPSPISQLPSRAEGSAPISHLPSPGLSPPLRKNEFWAVNDVSFELQRGQCLGLIGRNGAGKTTLLRMLNGLIKPDVGRIEMRGRLGALIALGAGFNPILTGRENIYVNGSVLGLTKKEINEKIESIIDFADIRDFIDSPVQNYSSGMQVRLGFAVATALDPDVLLLDEVLAVGDAAFRSNCYSRIGSMLDRTAVIFVSHSMEQVNRICQRVILLRRGRILHAGAAAEGTRIYLEDDEHNSQAGEEFEVAYRPLSAFKMQAEAHTRAGATNLRIVAELSTQHEILLSPRLQLYDSSGQLAAETSVQPPVTIRGETTLRLVAENLCLNAGKYGVSLILQDSRHLRVFAWSRNKVRFSVPGERSATTAYVIPIVIDCAQTKSRPSLGCSVRI